MPKIPAALLPSGNTPVTVRFPLTEIAWKRVHDASPTAFAVDEQSDHFDMEYPTREDFDDAIRLLDGMVPYTEVTASED